MLNCIKNCIKTLFIKSFSPNKNHLIKNRNKTEKELIKGTHKNTNHHRSIIHFSINKAATQYVKSILNRCAVENGMTHVGISDYAFNSKFPYLDQLSYEQMQKFKHIFKCRGYLYGPFFGMVDGIDNLVDYKVILVIRDPRDILVSHYFSMAYSHATPSKAGDKHDSFLSTRHKAQNMTIDEYVISESDRFYDIFYRYQILLLNRYKNIHMAKYEEMISNFNIWLNDLIEYCEFDLRKEFIQNLIEENNLKKPKKEDVTKHMRKGVAGDYKEKLQAETIQLLNSKFEPILRCFHY